jgi:hypothetical protein
VWLHVRVAAPSRSRLALSSLAASAALVTVSCGAQPSDLQASVRAAAQHERDRPLAVVARPAGHEERIDDLLAAVAAGQDGDGLPGRIEALLRRDDDVVRVLLAFIRGDKATKLLVDALAASGTPASQDALCALARDVHVPAHVRAEAVSSLGLIKRPTASTMTAIAEVVRRDDAKRASPERAPPELAGPALFLAGSVARAGRAEHPAHAAAIEKIVLAQSARAHDTDEILDALAALGNLGSAAVLPRLRAAIGSGDARIRAAAIRALRLVPDPEADQLLAATLRRDHDPTVRAAAMFAAGFRKLDPLVDAIVEAAQRDPVEYVRAGAVTLLARNRVLSPRIDRALTDIATKDPHPDLRRLANGEAH